ncbi:MAG: hypothetical protein EGQ63_09335 [Clostridiales bacterium]|nr:hypothetical protein [Clostridiales bacterium]
MKKQFLAAYEDQQEKEKQQQKLHSKHKIKDENVVVVEKSNLIAFSVKSIVAFVHMAAGIAILILAAIGLLCLVYPDTRKEFIEIMNQVEVQVRQYIG